MTDMKTDVVVVGGGAAGLSGALALTRARRSVVVVDAGSPRNAPAEGAHMLLGQEGVPPLELLRRGRAEVEGYGGRVLTDRVTTARRTDSGFAVETEGGRVLRARRLLVATGVTDELPDLPNLRERWGRDVLHCPYCHGWEVRDRRLGVLALREGWFHHAQLLRQWSPHLTVFTGTFDLTADQRARLDARGTRVVPGAIEGLVVREDRLTAVRVDGEEHAVDAVMTQSRLVARGGFLTDLGLPLTEGPAGVSVASGPGGKTDVPGVWVAGNLTDPMAGVALAAAGGVMAGTHLNADLVEEDTLAALREPRLTRVFSAESERATAATVLGDRVHGLAL
ncbi:thioredoxin reductase [Crossiella equi]|uniref:Thioredoxin reductase n=1 Tax=Crossiella equi TaxID=130796 RepID=A0ABS5AQK3_9PSEU|nr:NAD(P)/FAD-dependent oxidoreductase [Crossiella equi]MBP2478677.1 thioredoxin reductase [Crossiella equi]